LKYASIRSLPAVMVPWLARMIVSVSLM